jgi:hypothetical protein
MEMHWLDETKLGSGAIFSQSIEDRSSTGIGYHGTTALAAIAIGRCGFQPLAKTIEATRKNLLLRWAEKLLPNEYRRLLDQFQGMVCVNFFPVSELALVHTEQSGGQGICETIKPVIEKLLAHPDLVKECHDWSALNQFLEEITMNQQTFPVVFAVDLQDYGNSVTWNPQGAYQVEGTVSPDKIRAILVAPKFKRFSVIDRRALLEHAQKLSEKQGHFAYGIRIETMRKSVGVQSRVSF